MVLDVPIRIPEQKMEAWAHRGLTALARGDSERRREWGTACATPEEERNLKLLSDLGLASAWLGWFDLATNTSE